jgi:TRAP-type uncharacterized transport system substrate-binding protein
MADEDGSRENNRRSTRKFNLVIGVAALIALLVGAYRAIPPSHVTIATGPIGGSYYESAEKYQRALKMEGVTVNLHPVPNSLDIAKEVNRGANGIEIGFVAQALSPEIYRHTLSLGAIEQKPLFIFVAKSLGTIGTPAGLRGRRPVMPPLRSASSEAALSLLAHYGVTPANTAITNMPIAQAVTALAQGHFAAGFFMLDPQDGFIGTWQATLSCNSWTCMIRRPSRGSIRRCILLPC